MAAEGFGDEESRIISRLAKFVFNRQSEDMRTELHESLVAMSLLSTNDFDAFTIQRIEDIFELKDFPSFVAITAIELKRVSPLGCHRL